MTFSLRPIYIIQARLGPDLIQNQLNDEALPCFIQLAACKLPKTNAFRFLLKNNIS